MRRNVATEAITKDSSESSSEESLDKIAAEIGKSLGSKENEELKQIVDSFNSAKTDDQKIDVYVRDIS